LSVLDGIVLRLDEAQRRGHRLVVENPVHPDEDFSERWTNRDSAYVQFDRGIRHFAEGWRDICANGSNPKKAFEELFGEVVP
jgi:hypothetical protein